MTRHFSYKFKKAARYYFAILWFFCFCLTLFGSPGVSASSVQERRSDLRQQVSDLQVQIDDYRASIKELAQQKKSLKGETVLLDNKIKAAELQIKQIELLVKEAEVEIQEKDQCLDQIELQLDREREILAQYIRQIYEYDQEGIVESIFKNQKFSDVFDQVNALEDIQKEIQEGMSDIKELRSGLLEGRRSLEEKRGELNQLMVLRQIQQRTIILERQEKDDLLAQTRGRESDFQVLLTKISSDAESIKKQLYLLEGIGVSMPLEQAYAYAKKAADLTGVRPAYLLAVLQNESSWGEKVGTGNWRTDMKPSERQAFAVLCKKLNINPDNAAVSRRPSYGWGGAMGPAQFLPSVWLSYEDKIARLTGHSPPNPWDMQDAFVAAALKLSQGGANVRTANAEWKAAQIYFAGSRWNNSAYYFYGDQVVEMTDFFQKQLEFFI